MNTDRAVCDLLNLLDCLTVCRHVYNSIQPQERVTNVPGHPFDPGFGFERYTDW